MSYIIIWKLILVSYIYMCVLISIIRKPVRIYLGLRPTYKYNMHVIAPLDTLDRYLAYPSASLLHVVQGEINPTDNN